MRIPTQSFWTVSFFLAQVGAIGQNGHRHIGKRQASISTSTTSAVATATTPKFEGLRLSYITEFETTTEEVTVAADPTTITEVVTQAAEAASTVTETVVQPLTVTEVVTVAGEAPAAVTITETIAGEAAATITVTETVAGSCETPADSIPPVGTEVAGQNGIGVSMIPIAQSALPTTTFDFDPFATGQATSAVATSSAVPVDTEEAVTSVAVSTSAVAAPSSAAVSTSAVAAPSSAAVSTSVVAASSSAAASSSIAAVSSSVAASDPIASSESVATSTSTRSMGREVTMKPTTTAQGEPTVLVPSVDLGGLEPDATAELGSAVQDSQPTDAASSSVRTRARINVSTLSLSSVLNLGKLRPATAGIEARATQAI
ncbi:hypothetical protein B0J13DRAFT_97497 [Dactylonectria estremocensis]|uniref:Uncharacterized protein n=1 Tax=Dactylonectria estremocensis TaxID=1079267 RepID=A0A9P9E9Y4_9HYPO|nr:hypothetical protein B0J13DRAFT_97497 [Dactylonectria estremocensis]